MESGHKERHLTPVRRSQFGLREQLPSFNTPPLLFRPSLLPGPLLTKSAISCPRGMLSILVLVFIVVAASNIPPGSISVFLRSFCTRSCLDTQEMGRIMGLQAPNFRIEGDLQYLSARIRLTNSQSKR
jgi:hypothetical protein